MINGWKYIIKIFDLIYWEGNVKSERKYYRQIDSPLTELDYQAIDLRGDFQNFD